jgi:hypothetical protein
VLDGDTVDVQRGFDGGVARQRRGVIVMIEKYGVDPEFGSQLHDLVTSNPMPDNESAAPGLQGSLQLGDAGVDELDTTVGRARERVEDCPVEHECAEDLPRASERVIKRGVIVIAQVASKPDQCTLVFRHQA